MAANGSDTKELTPRQRAAIAALIAPTARGVAGAAEAAGVSETQLYRWMKQPAFRAALAEAQGAAIEDATRRLTGLAGQAIEVLAKVMADEEATDTVRVRAATSVIELLLRLKDALDFEQRLQALEAAQWQRS
jgi:hypothetical protein